MTEDPIRIPAARLTEFTAAVLAGAGAKPAEAEKVAAHLVGANLAGHDSHGVQLLGGYVMNIQTGLVTIDAEHALLADAPVVTRIDARGGWGVIGGEALIESLTLKAKASGLAGGTIGNVHHLGRIGAYAERAAEAGLVSMHFVSVADHDPLVAPFRGSDARFGTNPVCIGFPETPNRAMFLLDMATSQIALGKARVALNKGVKVPHGSIINEHGMLTDDPSCMAAGAMTGALTPVGRHKGYGLAFACELLGGVLSGAGTIQPGHERRGGIQNRMLSILIDPDAFGDPAWMESEIEAMADYALASPPLDWDSPVLFPGDPERAMRGKRGKQGVPLDPVTVAGMNDAAEAAGVAERL